MIGKYVWSLLKRCMNVLSLIFFAAILFACTKDKGSNESSLLSLIKPDNPQEHIDRLKHHFETSSDFKYGKWTLGDVYFKNKHPLVQLTLPVDLTQYINRLRAQLSIKLLCPVAGTDDYWKHESAKPFLIYLSGDNGNAKAMVYCTKAFDKTEYNKAQSPSQYPAKMLVLPPENADLNKIDAQLSAGKPSYKDAQKALDDHDVISLQNYLMERPELVHMYSSGGRTLLFDADTINEVYMLLAFGANPNVKERDGLSVLEWTARVEDNVPQTKQLINMGADAKLVSPDYVGSAKLASLLLDNGAVITEDSLQNALRDYKLGAAEALYEHGARFNKDAYGYNRYLHNAVRDTFYDNDFLFKGGFKKTEAYVKYLDDLNLEDDQGLTALDIAKSGPEFFGKQQIIDLLVSHGAKESGLNLKPKKPVELLH